MCFNRELIKDTFKLFFSVYKFHCSVTDIQKLQPWGICLLLEPSRHYRSTTLLWKLQRISGISSWKEKLQRYSKAAFCSFHITRKIHHPLLAAVCGSRFASSSKLHRVPVSTALSWFSLVWFDGWRLISFFLFNLKFMRLQSSQNLLWLYSWLAQALIIA